MDDPEDRCTMKFTVVRLLSSFFQVEIHLNDLVKQWTFVTVCSPQSLRCMKSFTFAIICSCQTCVRKGTKIRVKFGFCQGKKYKRSKKNISTCQKIFTCVLEIFLLKRDTDFVDFLLRDCLGRNSIQQKTTNCLQQHFFTQEIGFLEKARDLRIQAKNFFISVTEMHKIVLSPVAGRRNG